MVTNPDSMFYRRFGAVERTHASGTIMVLLDGFSPALPFGASEIVIAPSGNKRGATTHKPLYSPTPLG
jgi:hypothetical protein